MEVKKLGNLYGFNGGNYAGNIYDTNGLAPTIGTCQGGNQQPMVIINNKERVNKPASISEDIAPTIAAELHGNLPKVLTPERTEYGKEIRKAYESDEVKESRHNMTQLAPREDGASNTLTTVQKDNLLLGNTVKVRQATKNPAEFELGGNVQLTEQYRIRKLTPKECGRLMGVSDEDIDKMAAVNSNAQLYKQFGNSIVVDVMVEMFRQLF